jgi:oligoendopeptidase F
MRIRDLPLSLPMLTFAAIAICIPVARAAAVPEPVATMRSDLYFPSAQAEEADRRVAFARANAFIRATVSRATKASALLALFHQFDDVLEHLYSHRAYMQFRSSENVDDVGLSATVDAVNAQWSAVNASMDAKLAIIAPEFGRLVREQRGLRAYTNVVHDARDTALHPIPPVSQGQTNAPRGADEYRRITASAQYPKAPSPTGDLDPRSEAATANADREVRRAAAAARASGRASIEGPLADALIAVVRARDERARQRSFADAPSAAYFGLGLTVTQVQTVLDATVRRADANKEYQRMLASNTGRMLSIADVRSYDIGLPPAGFTTPVFSLDEARRILPLALRPLGSEYVAEYTALLDPRNGRLDLSGGAKRDDTGYSQGFPGTISAVYLSPYKGTLDNLRSLIHEGGHATHRQLVNRHGVLPANALGPNYMFEAIAIFNELLLYDYLQQTATTSSWKAYYLQEFIDDVSFQVYGSATETRLEEEIHRGVMAGTVRNAADLDALTLRVQRQYNIWAENEPEQQYFWTGRSLFWRDPLYSVNYLYAGLLAAEFSRAKERDPEHFAQHYVALLANGFTDEPDVLLRRFLGIELHGSGIVDDAASLIEEKTAALRAARLTGR